MKTLPIYKIVDGTLTKISLVDEPAIEKDFMLFENQELKFSFDEEKHIAFGPAMIADKPIYRADKNGEYYIVFDSAAIEMLFTSFMKSGEGFNLDHSTDTDSVFLLEAFIKREGLAPIGYEDVPNGSLFISVKVEDMTLWEDLKAGKFNGFSIECLVDIKRQSEMDELIDELLK